MPNLTKPDHIALSIDGATATVLERRAHRPHATRAAHGGGGARSSRSPNCTCAPTRLRNTRRSPKCSPRPAKPGMTRIGFVSDPRDK